MVGIKVASLHTATREAFMLLDEAGLFFIGSIWNSSNPNCSQGELWIINRNQEIISGQKLLYWLF